MELKKRQEMNWLRKIWHLIPGLAFALLCQSVIISRTLLLIIIVSLFVVTCVFEYLRANNPKVNLWCQKYFFHVMREEERHKISGIPSYLGSMLFLFLVLDKDIAGISILFLAIGDPIASVIGISLSPHTGSWSKINGKNILGAIAFAVACLLAAGLYLHYYHISLNKDAVFMGALVGALVELLNPSKVINDNLSIPVAIALTIYILN